VYEFASGREAARSALMKLGCPNVAIEIGEGGCPKWPAGYTGSISHSCGYAIAIASKIYHHIGLAIDIEATDSISTDLWPHVFTSSEIENLESLRPIERPMIAAISFSAKEAFYKLQFPFTQTWLDFTDVEVKLNLTYKTFKVNHVSGGPYLSFPRFNYSCRFEILGALVLTGIALPNHDS
jgi:4'-phosphopantetheinyl transferase EntD